MRDYVIAIDQGTTSTRALLLDLQGRVLGRSTREVECLFPHPGWVECDAERIWVSVIDCINELLVVNMISMDQVAGIGITNQRETTVVFEKGSGKPVYHAIVWQSKQTQSLCDEKEGESAWIQKKTGLRMNPYFSASKIRFILDAIPNGQKRAEAGELLFGTIDTYLIYMMTKGKSHLTDASNASRTLLFDIFEGRFDESLCRVWGIPMGMLPEVKDNADDYGEASFFQGGVHILGVAGDQQAALFGQCCYEVGSSKNTYGTGCFMLMNIGDKPFISEKGLLTTVAWRLGGHYTYALEGSVFIGGAIVQWIRDQTRWISSSAESEEYANRVNDTAGVYFVPAFVGLGTPWWDDGARGAIFGLTRGADRHHITRAALFSIAYQSRDVIQAMKEEAHLDLPVLKVDGGASANALLMQFQSDLLQTEVALPECLETTAIGAGYLALLKLGAFSGLKDIEKGKSYSKVYRPKMDRQEADRLYRGWLKAVRATMAYKAE